MDKKRENTNNFNSPIIYRRYQDNNNNIKYKNYYSNDGINNIKSINDLIMKEKDYYPNNNNKRMEINNDLLKKFNSERNIDNIYNINNINNFIPNNLNINNNNFEKIIKENISLKENIKKYTKELSSKDFEIEGYKEKVKALIIKIKEKNFLLNSKMNSSQSSNNSINIEQYITENNNLKKENKKLEQIIKLFKNNTKNLNSYDNAYYNYFNDKYFLKEQNQNNFTINSFRLTFDKSKYLNNSLDNKYCIKESGLETNNLINLDGNLFIKEDFEIKNLNKIIEELKLKNDYEYKKYKKEIEENNRKYNLLIKENEKIKGEILKKNESLEEKINEINVLKIKNELLINNYNNENMRKFEEELRDNKIEIALKYRENEDLKAEINKINQEKLNKENIIEELNEDIENLKEINENNKKEINEKNNNIENLIKNINDLEIKIKDIMDKNEKIKKENIMIKNKNQEIKKDYENRNNDNIKYKDNIKIINNDDNFNNNIHSNEEYDKIKKENEILKKKINQLNECTNDLNNKIKEKNIEINNLKEASYSLINKQKNEFEKRDKNKNNRITPETYCIISQKKYNDLTWYLISNIFPNEKIVPKKYDNFRWVTGESINPNIFKNFYNDEVKLNDIYSYIRKLQDKLEQKEEEDKKNYKLKNNSESIKNEASSYFDISLNKSNSYKNININKNKINSYIDKNNEEFEKK